LHVEGSVLLNRGAILVDVCESSGAGFVWGQTWKGDDTWKGDENWKGNRSGIDTGGCLSTLGVDILVLWTVSMYAGKLGSRIFKKNMRV